MATQGLVSVREEGRVVMKLVAGIDGYNASIVAEDIRTQWPLDAQDAYDIAIQRNFGTVRDLVVVTLGETVFKGDDDVGRLYLNTFQDPEFNPRWESGRVDHCEVVDV